MTEDRLVVVATAEEAAEVPSELPLVITGVGKTAAAVATAAALARVPDPRQMHVINIGTAGALRDGVIGLHRIGTVWNHDLNGDAIRALGYDPEERLTLGTGPTLASGDLFVTDPAVRARLAESAELVDMEGYGVAFAARRFGARVTLIKHVSDNADVSAFDWPTAVADSARVLGDWLAEFTAR